MTRSTTGPAVVDVDSARAAYEELKAQGMKLDLTRGKPSAEQLDLAAPMLGLPGPDDYRAADGTDTRNYQGLQGLTELRELFAPFLQVPVDQLIAFGNSSLELMHDTVVHALLSPLPGAEQRWIDGERVVFLAPVPGYDRHFALCERLGVELVPVPMTPEGPDMDVVDELVLDPAVKGIWCVPKYSNPDGTVYSDETARRLAATPAAAPDFRIFWDDAYTVHHLTEHEAQIANILELCAAAGNPDRVFVFGSMSKITLAGAAVAFLGSSPANVNWWLALTAKRTIGPDKTNHLRHVRFLRDADGLRTHMRRHREIIAPKFAVVDDVLTRNFADTPGVSWSKPAGGYFVTLTVPDGTATEIVRLAKEAGLALTPAGATHPYGEDPQDRTIRLAPTFPPLPEVEKAMAGVAVCVRLALAERGDA
jgi:DNA-binding transcriptional MocR family regulator